MVLNVDAIRARHALIDRQSPQRRRHAYFPLQANISVTRRCDSLCSHCAPMASSSAPEKVTPDQASSFILRLSSCHLPIEAFYIEGGEPTLEMGLLEDILELSSSQFSRARICLESNARWASSPEITWATLQKLRDQAAYAASFHTGGNLDRFHCAIPLANLLNLLSHFWSFFPDGSLVFSSCLFPEDITIPTFVKVLEEAGMQPSTGHLLHHGDTFYRHIDVHIGTESQRIPIYNKHPALVGRARSLRQNAAYLEWRKTMMERSLDLREGRSFIYPEVSPETWQIITLGWDGRIYPGAMFMHTQTLPIGFADETMTVILERAKQDPVIRTLLGRGVGPIYRAALEVDRRVEALRDDRLTQEELLFDLLEDPTRALQITAQLLDEEKHADRHQALVSSSQALQEIFRRDNTGRELKAILAAAELLANMPVDQAIATFKETEMGDLAMPVFLTTIKNTPSRERKLALLSALIHDPQIAKQHAHDAKRNDPCYSPKKLKTIMRLYAAILGNDSNTLQEIIDLANTREDFEDALIEETANFHQLALLDVLASLIFSLPPRYQSSFFHILDKEPRISEVLGEFYAKYPGQMESVNLD